MRGYGILPDSGHLGIPLVPGRAGGLKYLDAHHPAQGHGPLLPRRGAGVPALHLHAELTEAEGREDAAADRTSSSTGGIPRALLRRRVHPDHELFESLSFSAFAIVCVFLAFELRYHLGARRVRGAAGLRLQRFPPPSSGGVRALAPRSTRTGSPSTSSFFSSATPSSPWRSARRSCTC